MPRDKSGSGRIGAWSMQPARQGLNKTHPEPVQRFAYVCCSCPVCTSFHTTTGALLRIAMLLCIADPLLRSTFKAAVSVVELAAASGDHVFPMSCETYNLAGCPRLNCSS